MIKYAQTLLRKHSWFVGICQATLICFSLLSAWSLRFDYSLPDRGILVLAAIVLLAVRLPAIWAFGLLHGWWTYTGTSDVLDIIKAVTTGSLAFAIVMRYVVGLNGFPRSIYLLEPLLTCVFLTGVRVASRMLAESVRQDLASAKKIVLIGAGVAAQTVIHELRRPGSGYTVVGCLDDDRSKAQIKLEGVRVLGTIDDLLDVVERYSPEEVLIAIPSASGTQMRRFVETCEMVGIPFRTVPALRDIIRGNVAIKQFRPVRIEDLLGRDPVEIDLDAVRSQIEDKIVLVTGAAGSIGSELCRQVLEYHPSTLLCVDQNETGMFYLERELIRSANGSAQLFKVADIGDSERMQKLFAAHKPEIVFHAAAYKHVPVMEANVTAAVKNNVFGLLTLLRVAEANGCKSFVLISSDKAVNPTSTMGATKRLCELIVSHRPTNGMRSVSVRFGNVLGSSGSVVPVLQEQLQAGKALTITHPEMKRFFMTIREAVSLVLQAFAIGENGDTLVLDMGSPVKITDLAKTLIRLSGKKEDEIELQFTGLRPGEKLVEELFYVNEKVLKTACPKIKKTRSKARSWAELDVQLDELRATLYVDGASPVRAQLKRLLPEFNCVHETVPTFSFTDSRRVGLGA